MSRNAAATREALIACAWRLAEESPTSTLAGRSVQRVAAAAGVSVGAVTHHFPTTVDLVRAMWDRLLPDAAAAHDDADTEAGGPGPLGLQAVRAAAMEDWEQRRAPEAAEHHRRLLRLLVEAAATEPGSPQRVQLRDGHFRHRLPALARRYGDILAASDVVPRAPFTNEEVARLVEAVGEGLLQQWTLDPAAIRDDLAADVTVGLVECLVGPRGRSGTVDDLMLSMWDPNSDIHPPARASADERLALALAVPGEVYADGTDHLTMGGLAAAAGVDVADLVRSFASVDEVAAVGFARHLPGIAEPAGDDPVLGLARTLDRLVRAAAGDRWAAAALLEARLASSAVRGSLTDAEDVRFVVALGPVVARRLQRARPDLSLTELVSLSTTLIDLALARGCGAGPDDDPGDVVTQLLGLAGVDDRLRREGPSR